MPETFRGDPRTPKIDRSRKKTVKHPQGAIPFEELPMRLQKDRTRPG